MDFLDTAIKLHQHGWVEEAEQAYREILAAEPNHSGAMHLLGVIHQQQGRHAEGLDLIGRAICINPKKAVYHNNYGAALLSLGRFVEAEASLRRALAIRANYADAWANLGMVETALGKEEAALESLQKALHFDPRHRDARKRLATLLRGIARHEEAVQLFEQALADHPTAETYADFGSLLLALGRTVEAAIAYRKAIGLKPDYATAHFNLGQALEEMHETIAAKGHYSLAAGLQPDKPLWQLRALICAPVVFDSAEEIGAYREGVKKLVEEWNNNSPSPPAPLPQAGEGGNSPSAPRHLPERSREIGDMIQHTPHAPRDEIHQAERDEYGLADGTGTVPATLDEILEAGALPSFGLAYHGRDQRRLKEQFAALYEPYFRDQPLPVGSGNRDRPRIGILVTRRHEGMFLQSMRGIIEQLDGERFEPVILCSRAILKTLKSMIRREGLRFVPFGDSLRDAIEQVRVAACDLIYYWEVGTDALNYFLPFARLAPVQCTGWATMTSGVPAVDWFFSSALVESPGSQEQYTERLWQSRTLFRYQDRAWPTPPATRGEFGLPEGRRLYLCFQNPLKLHPNIDPLLV